MSVASTSNTMDANVLPFEHAELLATRWWSIDEFQQHGVQCRQGEFTPEESELLRGAVRQYQSTSELDEEQVEDFILGGDRRQGFWEFIARRVPGRPVASIYRHAKRLYNPHDPKDWTEAEDSKLIGLVKEDLTWGQIGDILLRPGDACRNRHERRLVHRNTRRTGPWSSDEEARLIQTMQAMSERGNHTKTSKFWKDVAERVETRTSEQCRTKWCESLAPRTDNVGRIRWRKGDTKILVNKVASLNLDSEAEIPWEELVDESWKKWTAATLRKKWVELRATVDASTHRDVVRALSSLFPTTRAKAP